MFQNVHQLFGVKHIQNLLKELSPEHRAMIMKSIKYHTAMRDKYPVHGCVAEIQNLSYQIQLAEEELHTTLQQLAYLQQQQNQQDMSPTNDYLSQLQLGIEPSGNNVQVSIVPWENPNAHVTPQASYSNNGNAKYNNINYLDSNENNIVDPSWIQETYNCNNQNNNNEMALMAMQSQLTTSEAIPVQQETNPDYKEVHSFFNNIDDRQSYIGSTEVYESSLESSMKDSRYAIEQTAENELKSAVACFSLTSVI